MHLPVHNRTNPESATLSSASREFHSLAELCSRRGVTYGELAQSISGRAHAFFALIAVVPFITPLPLPGLSIAFGLYVMLVGLRIATGKGPWVPISWQTRAAPAEKLGALFHWVAKLFARLEGIVKPRDFLPFSTNRVGGVLISIAGLLLALPFPPGTNFPPAWSALLIALGIVEEDDLCWLIGVLFLCLTIGFFTLIIMFGAEGIQALRAMF